MMNNKELAIQEFLKEKQKRTEFYDMLKGKDGILKLFEKFPYFLSTIWLSYNEDEGMKYLFSKIQYLSDYTNEHPTFFEYTFIKYFINFCNVDDTDALADNYYKILNSESFCQLSEELHELEKETNQFNIYTVEEYDECDDFGERYATFYFTMDTEFIEKVILPIVRGDYDNELKKKSKQLIMKTNLTDYN